MEKRIFFHRRREGVDSAEFAKTYRAAHETLVAETGASCAVDIALEDQSPMDAAGMKARPIVWHGVSLRWGPVASSSDATQQLSSVVESASGWRVEETLAWDYDAERTSGKAKSGKSTARAAAQSGKYWPDGEATPGVKFVSLVAKPVDLPLDEFKERYANHGAIAREHHGGCWRYVQNVVVGPVTLPPGKIIHAVSELWFHSLDDFVERLYTRRPESVDAVAEDTKGFIDFKNTSSVLVQETVLKS
jgi:hypothetical protein